MKQIDPGPCPERSQAVRGSGNRHRSSRSDAFARLLQSQSPGAPTHRPLHRYDPLSFAMFFNRQIKGSVFNRAF